MGMSPCPVMTAGTDDRRIRGIRVRAVAAVVLDPAWYAPHLPAQVPSVTMPPKRAVPVSVGSPGSERGGRRRWCECGEGGLSRACAAHDHLD